MRKTRVIKLGVQNAQTLSFKVFFHETE
jgi:hypothetical protein